MDLIFLGGVKADMWEYMRSVHTENILCEQPFDEFVNKNQVCKIV